MLIGRCSRPDAADARYLPEMGGRNAMDPRDNIMAGTKYLSQMLRQHNGDMSLALAAYTLVRAR